MPVITIREGQRTETGSTSIFAATLSFDGRVNFPVEVQNPFGLAEEANLEWYFEDWLRFPMLDTVRATAAAASVRAYGENLFRQIFEANPKAYVEYDKVRGDLKNWRIEIEGSSPEFQGLHWEALRDRDLPRPLAVDCVMVRKSTTSRPVEAVMLPSPTINLLMVTARPSRNDVGYRTISRPLIEALENSQLRVKVDLLRPATYEALSRHLEEKGAGYYHIIHFDAHGALLKFDEFSKSAGSDPNVHLFKQRYGRGQMAAYEGVKAFVAMEGDEEDQADLVEATELANLLTGKKIPVCILNACQSGKQLGMEAAVAVGQAEDYRETSLGSRLMAAGMQMVVAMGYSVTVTAAKVMMAQVYQDLFRGKGLEEAIRLGRFELFNRKERRAYFSQNIDLEDWLLPVVYGNQTVDFKLREFSPQEEEAYFEAVGQEFKFVQPEYEFVGRDLDILRIEKALVRQNMLLLQGMGGTGKTTLLNFLRSWWEKTHFADKIFYFGYDERAWTLEQILFALGLQIYDRFEMGRFQAMNQAAQLEKMVTLLRGANHILILDNLESVTGQELSIQNTLPQVEQEKLRKFWARLAGGKTRVVFGSRSGEEWLKDGTFKRNVYGLRGLDPEARTQLAEKILERHVPKRAAVLRLDEDFGRLMKVLAGYPLAMEVVLPNLKTQSPSEILVALQAADINLDSGNEDKTKSILKCVEYSHSNLSASAQKLLLCLAPFSGFIWRDSIPEYAEELQKLEPFQDYDFANFDRAIEEAMHWGLLEAIDEGNRLLTIQPVFPYFLKTKLASLDEVTRKALQEGFKNHYQDLADFYNRLMESKDAQKCQLGIFFCRSEYENLYNALQTCLANRESISVFTIWRVLNTYLNLIIDASQKLKLAKDVYSELKAYPVSLKNPELNLAILGLADTLVNNYLELKNHSEVIRISLDNLDIIQMLKDIPEQFKQSLTANIHHHLGRFAQELREYEKAWENYRQALSIYIEFDDHPAQASTYHELGIVAQLWGKYGEAQLNYQQALQIKIEFDDRPAQANTYYQLGMLTQELREYEKARENYRQALSIYIEFNDRYSQAITYHQLGMLTQELREYGKARSNYQEALSIFIELGDRYTQASTYHQFGLLAEAENNFPEAGQNLLQALEIFTQFQDQHSIEMVLSILSRIYQTTQDPSLLESISQVLGLSPDDLLNIFSEFQN